MSKNAIFYGLSQLKSHLKAVEPQKKVFILFTGSKDVTTGRSWCPDCIKADPVIEKCLDSLPDDSQFITCYVGDRATWKNPENEFRTDKDIQLKCVPTLIQWKKNKVLKEEQCADEDLVKMLFEED